MKKHTYPPLGVGIANAFMKSAERALGSCATIFKHLSSCPSNKMCSKETIVTTHVIHLTARTAWHWIEDEFVYPGKCQAFRLDFILWFLQGQV